MTVPERVYLDHNATSPLRPEVVSGMLNALRIGGNPSSVHAEGRAARNFVERARAQVADLAGASPEDVVFTSGGTEANNMALRPGALIATEGRPVSRLVTQAAEHASVLQGHGFARAVVLSVDAEGRLDAAELSKVLARSSEETLVSVQFANSETGIRQPLADVGKVVRAHGACLHVDAVQSGGLELPRLGVDGVDAVSVSAHKLGGPQGIGALILAPDRRGPAIRMIAGGAQEGRCRAGTENVAGIVGFGVAAEAASRDRRAGGAERLRSLLDYAEHEVRQIAPDAVMFGGPGDRLPNTLCFAVPGLSAEVALMALDLAGIGVSSGSACSSGKVAPSHVLTAMGVAADLSRGAIRLSFGWNSSQQDVTRFARAFEMLLQRLYTGGRARAA